MISCDTTFLLYDLTKVLSQSTTTVTLTPFTHPSRIPWSNRFWTCAAFSNTRQPLAGFFDPLIHWGRFTARFPSHPTYPALNMCRHVFWISYGLYEPISLVIDSFFQIFPLYLTPYLASTRQSCRLDFAMLPCPVLPYLWSKGISTSSSLLISNIYEICMNTQSLNLHRI